MVERIGKSYDPLIGREVAKCTVDERIGKGGMGIVYRVRHRTLLKDFALKVLPIDSGITQKQIAQFFVEARAQAAIEHPNVVQVLDVDRFNNWFYILMQLVKGPSLREAMDAEQGLPWPIMAKVGAGTAGGLAAAHTVDPPLIHRDIKPNNILVGPGWNAMVLDFGLVFQSDGDFSQEMAAAGTTHYVPPELLVGRAPTPASDLYSLGITIFEAISNRRVFQGKNQQEVLRARLVEHPPKLIDVVEGIPPELSVLVNELLAPKPEKRPTSAAEVSERFFEIWKSAKQTELPAVPTLDGEALPTGGKLLEERPPDAQVAGWAREGKLLYSCRKCAVQFLKRRYEEGHAVPCPGCGSKLTVPDKVGLDVFLKTKVRQTAQVEKTSSTEAAALGVPTPGPMPAAGGGTSSRRVAGKGTGRMRVGDHEGSSDSDVPGALSLDPLERLHLPPALLGRDHVIARIFECGNGQVSCIKIQGADGLGKTRMLEELHYPFKERALLTCGLLPSTGSRYHPFDQLTNGLVQAMQLRIKALLGPVAKLYGPWIVELAGPQPDIESLAGVEPSTSPERLLTAFEALLEAVLGTEGATILFDDVDRMSDTVLPLWQRLVAKIEQHHTLLVLTHTEPLAPAVATPLAKLKQEAITLEPLQAAVFPPLFTSIFGLAPYPADLVATVNRFGEGNPARIVALVKSLVSDRALVESGEEGWKWSERYLHRGVMSLPQEIDRDLVRAADALPKFHQEVLGVLAQVEGGLTPRQLAEVGTFGAGQLAMVMTDLDRQRLVHKWNERLVLSCERLQQRFAAIVPEPKRPALHAVIARILEPAGGIESVEPWQAAQLAHHLTIAGDEVRAIAYQVHAARAFSAKGQLDRAAEIYESVLVNIGEVERRRTKKVALFSRKGDGPNTTEIRLELGELYVRTGQPGKAQPVLAEAMKLAQAESKTHPLLGRLERALALACARAGEFKQALAHFARIESDKALVDAQLLAEIAQLHLLRDEHARAHELIKRAMDLLREGPPASRLPVLLALSRFERRMGRWARVRQVVDEAQALITQSGQRAEFYAAFQAEAARAMIQMGELREAGQRLEAARRHLEGLEAELEVRGAITELMIASRHRESATSSALALRKLAEDNHRPSEQAYALLFVGIAAMEEPGAARKPISAALALFERLGSSLGRARAYMALAECDLAQKSTESAAAKLGYAEKNLAAIGLAWPRAQLEFLQGRLAYVEGNMPRAIEKLERASEVAEQTGQTVLGQRIRRVREQLAAQVG